jgi:biopolymer transport protein ExbD
VTKSSSCPKAAAIAALAGALAGCVADPGTTTAPVVPSPQREAAAPEPAPAALSETAVPHPIRVILSWRTEKRDVLRIVGKRAITDDADLETALREEKTAHDQDTGPPYVVVDARGEVPWKDIVTVVNTCKRVGIKRLEFAFGGTH